MSREREFDARELLRDRPRARFELGQVVATPGALAKAKLEERERCLARQVTGDWGELEDEDRAANETAVAEGTRLLSAYTVASGEKLWVITEWDRSVTTLLLPDEY